MQSTLAMRISAKLVAIFWCCMTIVAYGHEQQEVNGYAPERNHTVLSWQQLRFRGVARQMTEFTCGAASMATLAKYFWGLNVAEPQITSDIRSHNSKKGWIKIQKDGLNVLELKHSANRLGFELLAYQKAKITDLQQLHGPVIVHLNHWRV